jgi:glycosyltransferase involved in cell wall biosynthesis
MGSWICCQLGAREHYAVPRALQLSGSLAELITDLWIRPGALPHAWRRRLNGRFHPELLSSRVTAPNVSALTFELKSYARRENGWRLITERNDWFQRRALDQLRKSENGVNTVFAYSYAAERIFKFARERGWRTILGQIDPGPAEERIVTALHANSATTPSKWKPAPPDYWDRWRKECDLADLIVVNSSWSRAGLLEEGVPAEKIHVIPLAYDASYESKGFQRRYPVAFTTERPLRVLFLGQITLRKGAAQLIEAAKLLANEPVEFWFVGPTQIEIPTVKARIKWLGVTPRLDVDHYYKDADVFVLPTLSDGFGLTQLEAQSWKLPVIVSRRCGEVVEDGVNGVLLEEVSAGAIADVLRGFVESSQTLQAMSTRSGVSDRFSLQSLAATLKDL